MMAYVVDKTSLETKHLERCQVKVHIYLLPHSSLVDAESRLRGSPMQHPGMEDAKCTRLDVFQKHCALWPQIH